MVDPLYTTQYVQVRLPFLGRFEDAKIGYLGVPIMPFGAFDDLAPSLGQATSAPEGRASLFGICSQGDEGRGLPGFRLSDQLGLPFRSAKVAIPRTTFQGDGSCGVNSIVD